MKRFIPILLLSFALDSAGSEQNDPEQLMRDVQRSHIEANVPSKAQFDVLAHRDLLAYFKQHDSADVSSVEYELLRDGPTQSGVAYPKFYLWVHVIGGKKNQSGAVVVAAVAKERLEVYNFMSSAQIRKEPEEVAVTFPAALVPLITSRAAK